MESAVSASADCGNDWLLGENLTQADISTAVAWRFMMHIDCVNLDPSDHPALVKYSARAEALPEFLACPLSD
jgi:glutathione S-transferase